MPEMQEHFLAAMDGGHAEKQEHFFGQGVDGTKTKNEAASLHLIDPP